MQTSFMHPPFGFALFYLRSVAPSKEYTDRITKKLVAPVTTMQIYWGAVPFVIIQVVMVGLIIAFPGIVSGGLDKVEAVDMEKVRLQMESDMLKQEVPAVPEADPLQPGGDLKPEAEAETPAAGAAVPVPAPEPQKEATDKEIEDLFKQGTETKK
ncbi:MAG: C4-dicarboxylate transporter [Ramlibacter sp.]|nr:C4-dicarboxylate transporter [Ramlibacter sp.]